MFRLVATDIDGTLIADSKVSNRTKRALRIATDAGLKIVPVSTRAPRSMKWVAEIAGLDGFAICLNGALIYDLDADVVVRVWPLDGKVIPSVVERLRNDLPKICFHWEKEQGLGRDPAYESLSLPLKDHEIPLRLLCDVLEEPESIAKLNARHPDFDSGELSERALALLGTEVHVTMSDPGFIEITGSGVTKASALAWLCESLGIESEEVIAFGDMPNDIPMLSWAGYSVVMGNAQEAVKQMADEIAPQNSEDGVAVVLERFLESAS